MKKWARRILKFLSKRTIYYLGAGITSFFILILLVGQSSETYTAERLLSLAKDNPGEYSLLAQNYMPENKNFSFAVISKNWSYFNQAELLVDPNNYNKIYTELDKAGIKMIEKRDFWTNVKYRPMVALLYLLATFGVIIGISFILQQQQQDGASVRYSPGKNNYGGNGKEKEEVPEKLTFSDVAGIDEVKDQIMEIVDLFKDSSKIYEMGGKIPKGIILNGPPGTGKTLLAKVTAQECDANFIHASGSDFVEMYVGVGARRVREIFEQARRSAPCILFIDEIDAVAGKRGMDNNSEREQTLNQLLVELDGFNGRENVLVFAATNQIDKLDPALLRPGRFDRKVEVHLPDENGRAKILKVYLDKSSTDKKLDVQEIARSTSGFSGADLANLVNEAILFAARNKKDKISQSDLLSSKDKILMGAERRIKMNQEDQKQTAVHEIGHAFICHHLKLAKLVNLSIVPRGRALGVTQMEAEDVLTLKKDQAINQLAMMMGGRVAESIFFDHLSTGAQNDLQRSWNLSRNFVASWGMSVLGPISLDDNSYRMVSEATREKIDNEIINIIKAAESLAESILTENRPMIEALSNILLEKQTITAKEFDKAIKGINDPSSKNKISKFKV
jgi:cell division protease FtsH